MSPGAEQRSRLANNSPPFLPSLFMFSSRPSGVKMRVVGGRGQPVELPRHAGHGTPVARECGAVRCEKSVPSSISYKRLFVFIDRVFGASVRINYSGPCLPPPPWGASLCSGAGAMLPRSSGGRVAASIISLSSRSVIWLLPLHNNGRRTPHSSAACYVSWAKCSPT